MPASAGMTVYGQSALTPTNVIPAQAGIHARFRWDCNSRTPSGKKSVD